MDDITEKISELLNSPDGMEKLQAAAQSILGNMDGSNQPNPTGTSPDENRHGAFALNDSGQAGVDMQGILRMMNLLRNLPEDHRIELLQALKPHLSDQRAKRVDRAVSLLRITALLPVLKEEGLLDSLGL